MDKERRQLIRHEIKEFLFEHCFIDKGAVEPDTDLFESGLLSSADMIDLVLFLEEKYSLKVDPMEINVETLGTFDMIADFILERAS